MRTVKFLLLLLGLCAIGLGPSLIQAHYEHKTRQLQMERSVTIPTILPTKSAR